jgi:hypothetical protein
MGEEVTVLFRPVGPKEPALFHASSDIAFPPRLSEQSIFYPVLRAAYATRIARDWNIPHSSTGSITHFSVRAGFLSRYEVQAIGGSQHQEYWIPAEDMDEVNRNIVGRIEVVAAFGAGGQIVVPEPGFEPGMGPGQAEEPAP